MKWYNTEEKQAKKDILYKKDLIWKKNSQRKMFLIEMVKYESKRSKGSCWMKKWWNMKEKQRKQFYIEII